MSLGGVFLCGRSPANKNKIFSKTLGLKRCIQFSADMEDVSRQCFWIKKSQSSWLPRVYCMTYCIVESDSGISNSLWSQLWLHGINHDSKESASVLKFYSITQWSCSVPGSLWKMQDSNQKSGALPNDEPQHLQFYYVMTLCYFFNPSMYSI